MKIFRLIIVIFVLVATSGCASVKPLSIDMSGKDYPEIDLKLDSIANTRYVTITNSDGFKKDSCIYSFFNGYGSVFVTKENIYISEILRNKTAFKLWAFNNKGQFTKGIVDPNPHAPHGFYAYFDINRKGQIYTGLTFNCYAVLDINMNIIPRFTKRKDKLDIPMRFGTIGVYLLKKSFILSYGGGLNQRGDSYILKSKRDGRILDTILRTNNLYRANFIELDEFKEPSVIKACRGFILPQSFTDTVRFVNNRGKVSPYIINSNPTIYAEDDITTPRFWIYPTVVTNNYIFFVSPPSGSVKISRYYVYDKKTATMYQLKNDYSTPQELDLVNNKCYFKNRNLMLTPNMVNEFFPLDYLRANMDKLPADLKAAASKLTDNDSGVLVTVEFDEK